MFQKNGTGFDVLDEFRRRFHLSEPEYLELSLAWKPFHEAYSRTSFYLDGSTRELHAYAFLFVLAQDEQRITLAYVNHHHVSPEFALRKLIRFRNQFNHLLLARLEAEAT